MQLFCYGLLSFVIPISLLGLYLVINHISLDHLLLSDANEQYVYLFRYLKEILTGQQSIFYSFSKGLGGPMWGTFCYYLASPLHYFVVFISDNMIPDFMGFLSIVKIGLSGFTMYYYLDKHTVNHPLLNLTFSLSYAFMTYNIIYYFHLMWLDVVYLTPLVIHGCDQILDNKKSKRIIIPLRFTLNKKNDKIYLEGIKEVFFRGKTEKMDIRRKN